MKNYSVRFLGGQIVVTPAKTIEEAVQIAKNVTGLDQVSKAVPASFI